jgi:hypothetical protein
VIQEPFDEEIVVERTRRCHEDRPSKAIRIGHRPVERKLLVPRLRAGRVDMVKSRLELFEHPESRRSTTKTRNAWEGDSDCSP